MEMKLEQPFVGLFQCSCTLQSSSMRMAVVFTGSNSKRYSTKWGWMKTSSLSGSSGVEWNLPTSYQRPSSPRYWMATDENQPPNSSRQPVWKASMSIVRGSFHS